VQKLLYSVLAAFDKFRISACKKLLPVMAVVLAVWQALVYLPAFCFLLVQLSAL